MSFTTRGVTQNFNESKPSERMMSQQPLMLLFSCSFVFVVLIAVAFSIYNTTFTTLIVMLIGLLQNGALSIMQLIVFSIHWIALW